MKVKFDWKKPPKALAKEKVCGKENMLFLANQAAKFMDPYVPADNLVLAQNIFITADDDCGHIIYNSPYSSKRISYQCNSLQCEIGSQQDHNRYRSR